MTVLTLRDYPIKDRSTHSDNRSEYRCICGHVEVGPARYDAHCATCSVRQTLRLRVIKNAARKRLNGHGRKTAELTQGRNTAVEGSDPLLPYRPS